MALAAMAMPAQTATALQRPRPSAMQTERLFNIPAQPLGSALEAFSAVTGQQLIYDSRLADGRRSRAVVGIYRPEAALRMMLDGLDLTIRYTGPRDIAIVPISAAATRGNAAAARSTLSLDVIRVEVPPGHGLRADYSRYGQAVRAEIRRSLARDALTAGRSYTIQLDIWIAPDGKLRRSAMLRSSGQRKLDGEVVRVLGAVAIGTAPPEGMPQPIRVTIISI